MSPDAAAADPGPAAGHLRRHLGRLRAAAGRRPVLDLACGRGRNLLAIAAAGLRAVGIDRDADALSALRGAARARGLAFGPVRADLEEGHGIPLRTASCGAVLVFRYLHRPLAPEIERVLAPGGWLLYETFTTRQRARGWGPRRPAFLLEPGELPRLFPSLEVLAADEGPTREAGRTADLARLVARRAS